jgi:hypothetical protein
MAPFKSHRNARAFVYITPTLSEPRIKVRRTGVLVRANLAVSNKIAMKRIFLDGKGPFIINQQVYNTTSKKHITTNV